MEGIAYVTVGGDAIFGNAKPSAEELEAAPKPIGSMRSVARAP